MSYFNVGSMFNAIKIMVFGAIFMFMAKFKATQKLLLDVSLSSWMKVWIAADHFSLSQSRFFCSFQCAVSEFLLLWRVFPWRTHWSAGSCTSLILWLIDGVVDWLIERTGLAWIESFVRSINCLLDWLDSINLFFSGSKIPLCLIFVIKSSLFFLPSCSTD